MWIVSISTRISAISIKNRSVSFEYTRLVREKEHGGDIRSKETRSIMMMFSTSFFLIRKKYRIQRGHREKCYYRQFFTVAAFRILPRKIKKRLTNFSCEKKILEKSSIINWALIKNIFFRIKFKFFNFSLKELKCS